MYRVFLENRSPIRASWSAATVLNATLIAAFTKNKDKDKEGDYDRPANKKGHPWCFGMKDHIPGDAESGLVHAMRDTTVHVSDGAWRNVTLHGGELLAFGIAGCPGIERRSDARPDVNWHVAMRLKKRNTLRKVNKAEATLGKSEKPKAGIQHKVEHPFRVIKRQFSFVKARYRSLKKRTALSETQPALSNLWIVCEKTMATHGRKRPEAGQGWCEA